jgi:hypothetical protein
MDKVMQPLIIKRFTCFLQTTIHSGENMVKGARGGRCQSKNPFPRTTHDMCHFCVLFYNL